MRKFLFGVVAAAAIATPLALATSAEAANNLSTADNCTPVAEIFAAPAKTHDEYKWTPVKSNAGPTQWTLDNPAANTHRGFTVKGAVVDYFRDGTKSQVVIDTPAVQAVDGVTCAIPLPANPLDVTLTQPADTDKYTWTSITDNRAISGKVGITVKAKDGYVFTYGSGTLTSKVFALPMLKISYTDVAFGNVSCNEVKTSATTEDVFCAFDVPNASLAGTEGSYQWTSDFDLATQGTLTYKVNAEGTGYRGQVTYPVA